MTNDRIVIAVTTKIPHTSRTEFYCGCPCFRRHGSDEYNEGYLRKAETIGLCLPVSLSELSESELDPELELEVELVESLSLLLLLALKRDDFASNCCESISK